MTEKKIKEKPEMRTADDWGRRFGHFIVARKNKAEDFDRFDSAYQVAEMLYGWKLQAHHYQNSPFLLSEADFHQAMEAAAKFPTAAPHTPAVAPILGDKYKQFTPKKAAKAKD